MKISNLCLALGCVVALSGCDAFNSSFNEQFDKQFREQCVKAATGKGAPEAVASQACNCTMDKLKEGKSETEFNMPSADEQMEAMKSCAAEMGLQIPG
ncbi:hypothetical protein ACFOWX_02305 [Sphingorhabdus arenilitoris]|uniref:Lipoprotein n=1 Tax=Sphingorhabdus arenilitoris TaxID=1490041 RepID=A0ABV8RDF2_9SPHN